MKKILSLLFLSLLFSCVYAQHSSFTENNLHNEINAYYKSQYYPGVIESVEKLETDFPESVYLLNARIAKSDALVNLGRYEDAEVLVNQLLLQIDSASTDYAKCNYILGLSYYFQNKTKQALNSFYTVCAAGEQGEFYSSAVLYSGRSFYILQDYSNSILPFEYVISNGNKYTKNEFDEALVKLFYCYKVNGNNTKITQIYSQLNKDNFSAELFEDLTRYADQSEQEEADQLVNDLKLVKEALNKNSDFAKQEKLLVSYEQRVNQSKVENISDLYNSLLIYAKAKQNKWDQIEALYKKLENPDNTSAYLYACALYMTKQYSDAETAAKDFSDAKGKNLYANILIQNKKYSQAAKILTGLEKEGLIYDENKIELAKTEFALKQYSQSAETAKKAKAPLSTYIAGISYINLSQWQQAYDNLNEYINNYSKKYGYWDYAAFYRAYAAYKLGDYKKAASLFETYGSSGKINSYVKQSYELGSKAALLNNDFNKAASLAEKNLNVSAKTEDRQKAAIYLSQIYSESGKSEQAVKVLQPFTTKKSDFAAEALTQIALIYENQGQIKNADEVYERICKEYSGTDKCEQAMYRQGEIYYSTGNFKTAGEKFKIYIYEYPNGKNIAGAYYFSGDCSLKLEDYALCIMQNKILVSKFNDSVYAYGANKNLLQAYYAQENYGEALSVARNLVRNYSEQSANDGIGTKVIELERITTGAERKTVETESEYERYGKTKTVKGRIAGSKLVQYYLEDDKEDDAFVLALTLIPFQTEPEDIPYAAANCDFAADHYKQYGDEQKAAEMYLKAAGFYRACDNSDLAAAMLYAAAGSFAAQDMTGDAVETARLLKQLYPESKQAKRVDALLR